MLKNILRYVIMGALCCAMVIFVYPIISNKEKKMDQIAPVISFDKDVISTSVEEMNSVLLQGVTALDETDGDLSEYVLVDKIDRIQGKEFSVSYIVFDKSNNCGRSSRKLICTNYESPQFTIKQPLYLKTGISNNLSDYLGASDIIDGDLSSAIRLELTDNETVRDGIYEGQASVTNSVGDTVVIPIHLEFDNEHIDEPQIILKQYIKYMKVGERFYPEDYIDYVLDEGKKGIDFGDKESIEANEQEPLEWIDITDISCKTNLDSDTPGNYTAIYTYTSKETQRKGQAEILIIVEKTDE